MDGISLGVFAAVGLGRILNGRDSFVNGFVAAWNRVMNLDRIDLA